MCVFAPISSLNSPRPHRRGFFLGGDRMPGHYGMMKKPAAKKKAKKMPAAMMAKMKKKKSAKKKR